MSKLDLVEELRRLGDTPRGRFETAKLNLMEASWKHENTNPTEEALDKAVEDWVGTRHSWATKVGFVSGVLIAVGVAAFAMAFAAWGLRTFLERFS